MSGSASKALDEFLMARLLIQALPVRRSRGGEGSDEGLQRLTSAEMGRILGVPGPYATGDSGLLKLDVPAVGSAIVEIGADGDVTVDGERYAIAEAVALVLERYVTP